MPKRNSSLGGPRPRFLEDETGGGTALSLMTCLMLVLIGGLAVDGTNAWRHQQLLQQSADVAAHAGAVAFANGSSAEEARAAAIAAVQLNVPSAIYGNVFEDVSTDVVAIHYDPVTNIAKSTGRKNAVAVFLHRTTLAGNPVSTTMLNIVSLVNPDFENPEFEVNGASVATVTKTQTCNSTDGIYAKDQVNFTSSNTFGAGYCIHSQSDVWMPQSNTFLDSAGISMPDLADCGSKCTDSANPGSEAAAFERNLLIPDLEEFILATSDAFLDTFGNSSQKAEFFSGKSLEISAFPALEAEGIITAGLSKGAVVTMNEATFEALTDIPRGLVYEVTCTAGGNGGNARLTFSNLAGEIRDVAIITNCVLEFDPGANVIASLLLTTRDKTTASVTAGSGAFVGDPAGGCDVDERTTIMSLGQMNVPADFAGSNLSIIVDEDIHLSATGSSSTLSHSGISLMSSAEIHVSAGHTFNSCAGPDSGLMPELRVIRHVVPQTSAVTN